MKSDKCMLYIASAVGFAAVTALVERYSPPLGWIVIPVVLVVVLLVWGARDPDFANWRRRYQNQQKSEARRREHGDSEV